MKKKLSIHSTQNLLYRPGADSASQSDRSILDEMNMRGRRPRPN